MRFWVWGASFVLISHDVILKSFLKSQFPHKSVNIFVMLVMIKDKLMDLWEIDFCKMT